ncbi:PREDICTED: CAVP-target protein isoform X1 [Myotis brandtii]|uniref:CAVP-target protein isoform X1 n=1 Tax=Myotis brandtii TaxID=109478 RepID=UPI0003BBFD32|nr:PREDICTED: CAVP-target protein isoform X1 [Myotis brandtii]
MWQEADESRSFHRGNDSGAAPPPHLPVLTGLVGRGGGQGTACGRTGLREGANGVWELWALPLPASRSRKELRETGPPRVLEPLKDVVLIEGSAAKLTCRISAFPDPFIRWSKDGKELRDGPKYRYIFEDPDVVALVVRDGELADLGQYSINVTNPFGQCSDSARILVEVPAKIQKGPDNTKARKGTTVTLTAAIMGEPAPNVGWTKDGKDIEEDDRVYFEIGSTNTTLTIRRATPQDSGKYEVYVENSLGMDQSFARVDVA